MGETRVRQSLENPVFRQEYETAEAFAETADFLETTLPGAPVPLPSPSQHLRRYLLSQLQMTAYNQTEKY